VAAKWRLNDEELLDEARLLLDRYIARSLSLWAPSLIQYELANTLETARRGGRISAKDALDALRDFLALHVHQTTDGDALVLRAAELAPQLGLSAYDAAYVALAERLNVTLVTDDQGIIRSLSRHHVAVCPLKDVRSLL
jgi:predicted nucleic acid-binding protein